MSAERTIARLWRDAVARERPGAAYLVQHGDHWHEVSWAEAAERVENLANGLLARGVAQGRGLRDSSRGRRSSGRCSTSRSRRSGPSATPDLRRTARPRTSPTSSTTRSRSACSARTTTRRPRSRRERASLPRLRHVLTFDDLPGARGRGRASSRRSTRPRSTRRSPRSARTTSSRSIYTSGTTGPPKGCMIRHRNYYAMVVGDRPPAGVRARRRPDAALPPARAQLRPADAPDRAVRRLHDRVPARSAADRGGAADGAPDRAAERAPRLREDPHRRRRRDRRDDRRQAPPRRLVARRRARGRQARRRRAQPVGGVAAAQAPASPTSSCFAKIRARLGGRLRTPISGGAPLVQEIAEFFDAIGIRIFEGYGLSECTTAATTNTPERWRFGTVGPALPGFELRIAEDGELLTPQRHGLRRATTRIPRRRPRCSTRTAGCTPATSPRSTPTASSRSPTARRTSSSRPAARTSPRRTSRTTSRRRSTSPRRSSSATGRPYPAALVTLDEVEIGKWAAAQGIDGDMAALAADRAGDRARAGHRRRRQPRPVALRADQALRDPAARLHDGAGRGDADAEAEAPAIMKNFADAVDGSTTVAASSSARARRCRR